MHSRLIMICLKKTDLINLLYKILLCSRLKNIVFLKGSIETLDQEIKNNEDLYFVIIIK